MGARPQFIKYAPLSLALKKRFEDICINTGQHYDDEMSSIFFRELRITRPAYNFAVGSASHGRQTGIMLEKIEAALLKEAPSAVIVFGDTNTTLAGALAAAKLNIPLVHIEAGLRSFNKNMPEEKNRIVADHVSDMLIAPTRQAVKNLKNEGITKNVFLTGDIMVDSLGLATRYLRTSSMQPELTGEFILATIHRNYNTDDFGRLLSILKGLNALPLKVLFPVHPRTLNILKKNKVDLRAFANVVFAKPFGYFKFVHALSRAKFLVTDSGGAQKEAYVLKIPCITLRHETEWVETLKGRWNILVGNNFGDIKKALAGKRTAYASGLYGDGNAAKKITELIAGMV